MEDRDKYLIIVPHPDDELNVAGQLIYLLTKSHNQVHVLYTTNGDYYASEGKKRIKEAIGALGVLGVDEGNIIFLGYGDDWQGGKHIYNSQEDDVVISMSGCDHTYGLETHQDYRFAKSGYHHGYTRKNYKQDMADVILELLANVLIVVDFDSHPDHRCTSLMFEEVMGDILKARDDYKPIVLKKFAYAGVWSGPEDYYADPKQATCLESPANNGEPELETPAYSWENRIRFEAPAEALTPLIKKNIIYKAAKKHKTQGARFVVNRICSADIVYWLRKTNSLSYQAKISASSGESKYLNDFKLVDCPDVRNKNAGLKTFGNCIWIPDKADNEKIIYFHFLHPVTVSCLSFYANCSPADHILNGIIEFDNGFRVDTGRLDNSGRETIVEFETQQNVRNLSFRITEFVGDNPGLTEIEIYEKAEKVDLDFIARAYSSEKLNSNKTDIRYHVAAFIEKYLLKVERKLTEFRVNRKVRTLSQ